MVNHGEHDLPTLRSPTVMSRHETHSENTLRKVYEALLEQGIYGQQATDVVSAMQNRGILFREAREGVR